MSLCTVCLIGQAGQLCALESLEFAGFLSSFSDQLCWKQSKVVREQQV